MGVAACRCLSFDSDSFVFPGRQTVIEAVASSGSSDDFKFHNNYHNH